MEEGILIKKILFSDHWNISKKVPIPNFSDVFKEKRVCVNVGGIRCPPITFDP